jgi:hypothetical protein
LTIKANGQSHKQCTAQARIPAKQQTEIATTTLENPPAATPKLCMRFAQSSVRNSVWVKTKFIYFKFAKK